VLVSAAGGESQKSKALFHAGLFSESPNAFFSQLPVQAIYRGV